MSIAETLTSAIGAFKLELDFRDNIRPRRTVTVDKVIITETGFSSQLPGSSWRSQEQQSAPSPRSECSLANVTVLYNATEGTDFGIGTPRPLKISRAGFLAAVNQFSSDPAFTPLETHSGALAVTPPCAPTGAITGTSMESSSARVAGTCFQARSTASCSGADGQTVTDPECPDIGDVPGSGQRTSVWGASGIITEFVDFGDVAIAEASFAEQNPDAAIVWVSYSFSAEARWECTSACSDGTGGTSSEGAVCSSFLQLGDPLSPPSTPVTGSAAVVVAGAGWANDPTSLCVYFQDPTISASGCTPRFDVTY